MGDVDQGGVSFLAVHASRSQSWPYRKLTFSEEMGMARILELKEREGREEE